MATTRDVSRQVPTARRDRLQQFDSQEWQGIEVKVLFIFNSPDGGKAEDDDIKWEAFLLFKARDLPRLMREGFHWNAANLDREAGYIERRLLSDDSFNDEDRWSCSRTFFLSDLSDDPQWAAKLIVYPEKVTVLSSFTTTNINMDTMNRAAACKKVADQDRATHWVYFWHRNYLEDNFNAIYDDMPLTGWWPWLRQEVDDDDITLMDVANEWRETWIPVWSTRDKPRIPVHSDMPDSTVQGYTSRPAADWMLTHSCLYDVDLKCDDPQKDGGKQVDGVLPLIKCRCLSWRDVLWEDDVTVMYEAPTAQLGLPTESSHVLQDLCP